MLLHLESGAYHGLNETGSLIWGLLDGERDFAALVAGLRERLEDPPTTSTPRPSDSWPTCASAT